MSYPYEYTQSLWPAAVIDHPDSDPTPSPSFEFLPTASLSDGTPSPRPTLGTPRTEKEFMYDYIVWVGLVADG